MWSPDGKEIAFYSNRTDNYGIWAVKPDGSGLRPVTERSGGNDQNLLYPVFSPAGDRLVASRVAVRMRRSRSIRAASGRLRSLKS